MTRIGILSIPVTLFKGIDVVMRSICLLLPQKCSTQSYVDDTKLITSFQLKDNLDAVTDLKDDLFKIGEWCSNNLVT